jgi:hypothetical protein
LKSYLPTFRKVAYIRANNKGDLLSVVEKLVWASVAEG